MSEPGYFKCSCPHCGQSIAYPAEGTGQTVPCPTCEKPVALTPIRPPILSTPQSIEERDEPGANWRSDPATSKQKEKLRWFGFTFDEGISKGEASAAIDKCTRENPEKDDAYNDRPATEDQLEKIRQFNRESQRINGKPHYDFESEGPLTYGDAKEVIQEWEWDERDREMQEMDKYDNPPTKAQLALLKESGIKLDSSAKISEAELEGVLALDGKQPREVDLSLFKQHGISTFKGDAFAALALGDLIRCFGGSAQDHNRAKVNFGAACKAALRDPDYLKPTLGRDDEDFIALTWPKSKINEWLRAAKSWW